MKASLVESDHSLALIHHLLNCLSTSSLRSAIGLSGAQLAKHQRQVYPLIRTAATKIANMTDLDQKILTLYAQSVDAMSHDVDSSDVGSRQNRPVEQCEICDAAIEFEAMDVARCQNGHQFSKICSLVPREPANISRSLQAHAASNTRARHLQILRNLQCTVSPRRQPTGRGDESDCIPSFDNGKHLAHPRSISCCRQMLEMWWEILDDVNYYRIPHTRSASCIPRQV